MRIVKQLLHGLSRHGTVRCNQSAFSVRNQWKFWRRGFTAASVGDLSRNCEFLSLRIHEQSSCGCYSEKPCPYPAFQRYRPLWDPLQYWVRSFMLGFWNPEGPNRSPNGRTNRGIQQLARNPALGVAAAGDSDDRSPVSKSIINRLLGCRSADPR
jgi:hypothetical protein